MHKLSILLSLGLSAYAQFQTADFSGLPEYSIGWYAGACTDEQIFNPELGFVVFNCGSECDGIFNDMDNGGSGSESLLDLRPGCYYDDYGDFAEQVRLKCLAVIDNCYGDT